MSDQPSILQQFLRAVDTGKSSALDGHLAASYNDHNPPPFASKAPGLVGVKETYDIALGIFADFKHVVEDTFTEGDRIVSRIVGSGRHVGPLLGISPTQKQVTMSGLAIHRVANGKLVEHWGQIDGIGLLAQVGAVPAPPAPPPVSRAAGFEKRADSAPMPRDEMKRLVRLVFDEALNKGNDAAASSALHSQYLNHSFVTGVVGPEGLARAVGMFRAAFPDMHLTLEDVIADENKAATRGYFTGTHKGEFHGVPATGRSVKVPFIDIWHGYEGRLLDNWVQMDMLGALVQLGAIPAPQG
jgi:predicted ester cyclase